LDPTSYERMIFVRTEQMPPCGETHGNPNSSIPARTERYNKVRRTITARCSKPSCATCLEIQWLAEHGASVPVTAGEVVHADRATWIARNTYRGKRATDREGRRSVGKQPGWKDVDPTSPARSLRLASEKQRCVQINAAPQ